MSLPLETQNTIDHLWNDFMEAMDDKEWRKAEQIMVKTNDRYDLPYLFEQMQTYYVENVCDLCNGLEEFEEGSFDDYKFEMCLCQRELKT